MKGVRAKGTRLEHLVKHRLEEKGYLVVRAAGSHSPFDLVALKSAAADISATQSVSVEGYEVLCVQVKANRKPTMAQVEAMMQVHVPSEVWVHRDRVDAWDIYEPTLSGLKLVRQEPYTLPRTFEHVEGEGDSSRQMD